MVQETAMPPLHARPASWALAITTAIFALSFAFQITTRAQDADDRRVQHSNAHDERGSDRRKGREIFRFDTFGDEQLWTTVLRMHEVIPTVDPVTALSVGLKVDVDALPRATIRAIRADEVDLTDPAITLDLLRLNAIVGVKGQVDDDGQLTSIGITCALCHSTVDN